MQERLILWTGLIEYELHLGPLGGYDAHGAT